MSAGPCRLVEGERAGWRALTLENDLLRATLLPDKGADLVELVDVASGTDVLFHAPWGLQPPGAPPRGGSDGHAFLENYGGGWQELFPSAGDPCVVEGEQIPFHGEVATLPWDARVEHGGGAEVSARCSVRCRRTPFRLERTMRLTAGVPTLVVEEAATNDSSRTAHLVWGHHCVLGPPFVEGGCTLRVPAATIETIPELWEDTARLEPGQRSPWPHGRLRRGGTTDLSVVCGPEEGSHDDVYLTGLDGGWLEVVNPRLALRFRLEWDPAVFRWVISWQPYGGALALPLAGAYALGVEPWTTRLDLARAIEAGEAIAVGPGETVRTTLGATVGPPVTA